MQLTTARHRLIFNPRFTATIAALVDFLNSLVPGSGYLWQNVSLLVSFGVTTAIFAMMYTVLPDAEIAWRDTLVGAIATAILFLVGQFLFGLFLSETNFGSAYGVAGSFVIVIPWIFYATQVLLLGAEFTKIYAKQRGSPIVPSEYAVSRSHDDQERSPVPKRKNTSSRQIRQPR